MTDIVNSETRSRMMAGIKGRDTRPEIAVRRYLHAAGLRFRVNDRRLPGTPDLVFRRWRVAVFVHGCFWHRHPGCPYTTTPATRAEFWSTKFNANMERDDRNLAALESLGWSALVIWECESRSESALDELFWRILACKTGSSA